MGRRVFLRRCRPESVVHCPQSAVRSPQSDVCNLYTVDFDASYITELENRRQNLSNFFPACFARCDRNVLKSKNIVFPRQKHSFSSSSKYGTGMDSEMMQDILFENEQKYFSRLKHADTVALIRALKTEMGFFTERYSTVLCSRK